MKKYYIIITPFFPNSDSFRGAFIYDQVRAIAKNSSYEVVVFKSKSITSGEKDYMYRGIQVHLFDDIQMPSSIFLPIYCYPPLNRKVLAWCLLRRFIMEYL